MVIFNYFGVHNQKCFTISFIFFADLADVMKRLVSKYDNLFETSFPYSMGWHGNKCFFSLNIWLENVIRIV